MRIAHFGTFDVENYGDLLFPLILENRLGSANVDIVHVSPAGGDGVFSDGRASTSLSEALRSDFDAVVVGGGNIVHARTTALERYAVDSNIAALGYAGLWLGASELAARLEVPLVWNAPGVPAAFGRETAPLVAWAAAACDYLAVRDERSAMWLRAAGFAGPLSVVPDTGIEVSRLWGKDELREAFREAFESRGMASVPGRTVLVHLNARYATDEAGVTAERVARIARTLDAVPILCALGGCHGDSDLARRVVSAMPSPVLLIDRPRSLREIVACIEGSVAYFGSSLHGLITACAFSRPAILVARESRSGAAKFSGFLDQWGAARKGADFPPVIRAPSWLDAEALAGQLAGPAEYSRPRMRLAERWQIGGSLADRSSRHWSAVSDALQLPRERRKSYRGGSRQALERLLSRESGRRTLYQAVLDDQRAASG